MSWWPCAAECCELEDIDCLQCSGDLGPAVLCVNLNGIQDDATCTNCTRFNDGRFAVVFKEESVGAATEARWDAAGVDPSSACWWQCIIQAGSGCDGPELNVFLGKNVAGDWLLRVTLDWTTDWIIWQQNLGASKPNCRAWNNQTVAHLLNSSVKCISSGSTIQVSALGMLPPAWTCCASICSMALVPQQVRVIVEFFGNCPGNPCTQCAGFNGTYIFNLNTKDEIGGSCRWTNVPISPSVCSATKATFDIVTNVVIRFEDAFGILFGPFILTPPAGHNCTTWDYTVNYDSTCGVAPFGDCGDNGTFTNPDSGNPAVRFKVKALAGALCP